MSRPSWECCSFSRNSASDRRPCPLVEVIATHNPLGCTAAKERHLLPKSQLTKWEAHLITPGCLLLQLNCMVYKCWCHKNYALYISCWNWTNFTLTTHCSEIRWICSLAPFVFPTHYWCIYHQMNLEQMTGCCWPQRWRWQGADTSGWVSPWGRDSAGTEGARKVSARGKQGV